MLWRLLETEDEWSLMVLRLTVGIVILPHGLQKLFGWFGGHGMASTIESFGEWFGLPAIVTVLVILAESIGALCLIVGLGSRIAAASIGAVMIGAIYFVVGRWGFFMNWYSEQRGEGFEYHILVLGIVLVLALRGSGKWSIDRMISGAVRTA